MNKVLQWDDLRIVLAITAAGSLSGAARRLGVSHATVFRRLGDIEGRVGVKLFERGRSGYTPTVAGEEVAAAAGRVEIEVVDIERRVMGQDLRPHGTVCVTTTDTLLVGLLSPIFSAFRQAYPDIALEVVASSHVAELSRREADIAIRPVTHPSETLVGRRVGTIEQAIYVCADRSSREANVVDVHQTEWLGPDARMGYQLLEKWMEREGVDAHCRYRMDSVLGMRAAVRDGAGCAVIPCYLGEADDSLARIGDPIPDLSTDLWLLIHPDLRGAARIRAVLDFVADGLRAGGLV